MTTVRVLAPVLARPDNVPRVLRSLEESRPGVEVAITFITNYDDHAEHEALREHGCDYIIVGWQAGSGDWARKINHAVKLYDEDDWFLLGADDIHFHPGWAKHALACARNYNALVVGTEDMGNREARKWKKFSTHPLVHRTYIERGVIDQPGKLLNEDYDHNFPDRELAEYAAHQGVWCYCDLAMVEHMHPGWGKAESDWVYRKGVKNFSRDQRRFHRRQRMWRSRSQLYKRRISNTREAQ